MRPLALPWLICSREKDWWLVSAASWSCSPSCSVSAVSPKPGPTTPPPGLWPFCWTSCTQAELDHGLMSTVCCHYLSLSLLNTNSNSPPWVCCHCPGPSPRSRPTPAHWRPGSSCRGWRRVRPWRALAGAGLLQLHMCGTARSPQPWPHGGGQPQPRRLSGHSINTSPFAKLIWKYSSRNHLVTVTSAHNNS